MRVVVAAALLISGHCGDSTRDRMEVFLPRLLTLPFSYILNEKGTLRSDNEQTCVKTRLISRETSSRTPSGQPTGFLRVCMGRHRADPCNGGRPACLRSTRQSP